MIKRIFWTLALAGATAGCTTHLEVERASAADPRTRQGIAYFLPFTQFDTKVSWIVTGCEKQLTDGTTDGALELTIKTEATPKTARDPDHLYTIDYSSLDAWTKTSSVKVDFYDSGAIKAINASADDRTAEIATKTISAIGKIAKFAAVGAGESEIKPFCSEDVHTALDDARKQKSEVTRLTKLLDGETYALQAQTARITRGGDATSPDALKLYDQMIANVAARQIEVDLAKSTLAAALKTLTHTEESTFPTLSSESETEKAIKLPEPVFRKWIGNLAQFGTDKQQTKAIEGLQNEQGVWLQLEARGGWQKGQDFAVNGQTARRAGLRYRVGVPGELLFCTGAKCSDTIDRPTNIDRVAVILLQNSTTFYLPFSSEPLTNAALSATFSEAGVLTSAGYEQKKSQGEAAAGIADALADQVVGVGTAFRDAELTRTKQKTELAKAQKELADAEKALIESPNGSAALATAAFNADTALKQAEVSNIQAEIALTNARALRDGHDVAP